jgi:hypothetical protein
MVLGEDGFMSGWLQWMMVLGDDGFRGRSFLFIKIC